MVSIARRNNPPLPISTSDGKSSVAAVGLGILTQIVTSPESNIILLQPAAFKFNAAATPTSIHPLPPHPPHRRRYRGLDFPGGAETDEFEDDQFCSFLRSCCLCKEPLKPDKDVYMYRGDRGFCSIECRNRQIAGDEVEEKRALKKMAVPHRSDGHSNGQCETRNLLEELQARRLSREKNKTKAKYSETLIEAFV